MMTLDEARMLLEVGRGATRAELTRAFHRQARRLHPDMHPDADGETRRVLARDFDRLRQARDVLLLLAPDDSVEPDAGASVPRPASAVRDDRAGTASPEGASPAAGPATRSRPARTTLRFDEFVRVQDADGFGPGVRSRPPRDVARIIAWSVVGALALTTAGALAFAAVAV